MITAIASIFAALAGMVPSVLQFFTIRANNDYNLRLRELDIQATREGAKAQVAVEQSRADTAQLEHIYNFANNPSGVKWIDALAIFVRPYITLVMFHVWLLIEVGLFVAAVNGGLNLEQVIALIWDADSKALFAAVISFWFGDRMGRRGLQMALQAEAGKK